MIAGLYTLGDLPAGFVVALSAMTLYITGREFSPASQVGKALANVCFWASISIASVAFIYWSFAISVDYGNATRPWLKGISGISAGISAILGARFILVVRKWTK